MKKKVILSFDYELFFGDRSGTVEKSLIEPTNMILDAMDSVGLKGNFFVDWQMLKYLKEENTERTLSDYNMIVEQLKDMIRRGHRIELHIHPHWVDAQYNGDGTWDFSEFRHYSLNSFEVDEIVDIFKEGAKTLLDIARQVEPEYELCAFRAGGWAVQPFDKVKYGMEAVRIRLDSSVMPGYKITCQHSKCNFIDAPETIEGFYRFSCNVCEDDEMGGFVEVPITTFIPNFWFRAVRKLARMLHINYPTIADGTHTRVKDKPDIWEVRNGRVIATFSRCVPIAMLLTVRCSKSNVICLIDHPKDYTNGTPKAIKLLGKITKPITYKELLENEM